MAVVGLGQGFHHARAYQRLEGVRVLQLCDINRDRLHWAMRELNVPNGTTDINDVIRNDAVRLVSICTPNHLHYEHALPFLKAGKHLLIEKPMTTSLAHAQELVDLAARKGCLISVGMVLRFVPSFRAAVQWVQEGRLGRVFYIEGRYLHDVTSMRSLFPSHRWWVRTEMLFAGGVHPLDLMLWALGDIEEVYALSNKTGNLPEMETPDQVVLIGRFRQGAIAKVWTNVGIVGGTGSSLTVAGTQGTVHAESSGWDLYWSGGNLNLPEGKAGYVRIPFRTDVPPLEALTANVCSAVRGETELLLTGRDGLKAVAVLEAGVLSYRTNSPQKVPQV